MRALVYRSGAEVGLSDVTMVVQCVYGWCYERDKGLSGCCGSEIEGGWKGVVLLSSLFADDPVLLAENNHEIQRLVDEFVCVCKGN